MIESQIPNELQFLAGGGATGEIIRVFDWASTPLDSAEAWSQPLRTAVSLMLGAAQPVYIAWGPELTSLYNDAYLPIVGTKHPGIGLPFRELWAEIWTEFRPIVEKTLAGDAQHFIDRPIALAGRPGLPTGYFTFSYSPLRDADGAIAGFYCAATETTGKVLAEQRLLESEDRFRNLADHAPVMMWVTNPDGYCTYLNRGWYAFTGQTDVQAAGFGWLDATHPDDKAEAERIFLQANAARVPFRLDYRLRRADGSYRWALDAAQPRFSESGEYLGYIGSVIDITDRKLAESKQGTAEKLQAFLLRLSDTLRPLETSEEICYAASQLLGTEIKANRVFYAEAQRDDETIVVTRSYTDGVLGIEGRHRYKDYGATLLKELQTGQTYRIDDVAADVALAQHVRDAQARMQVAATLNVPLVKDGQLVGLLGVHFQQAHAFSDAEIALTEAVAERTWAALTRARAEAALRESEERLSLAIENAEIGFWDVDVINNVLIWSTRTKAMFGISADSPTTMQDFYDGLHPEDLEATSKAYAAAADPVSRPLYDVEYRAIGKEDGIVRWVAAKGRGVFDEAGLCLRVAGTAIDITARKATERALIESEARLRAVLDAAPVGLLFANAQGVVTGSNARLNEIIGKPVVKSRRVADYGDDYVAFHADGRRVESNEYPLATIVSGKAERAELDVQVQLPDATLKWVRYIGTAMKDDSGMFGAVIASLDIDREKRLSENLAREVEAAVASVVARTAERDRLWQNSQDVFVIGDSAGIFRSVNPSFTRILGWTEEEVRGRSVFDFIHPDDKSATFDAFNTVSTTQEPKIDNRYRAKDGGWRWLSWVSVLEGDFIYASARHVTAEKEAVAELAQAQEALRQSQKMEAMGSLTGGVAHDFNNLLTPIFGSLDMLLRRGVGDEREQRLIAGAFQSAERAKTLVQRLLAFARRQPLQPVPVDVADLARGIADLVSSTTGPQIRVTVDAADDLPLAKADPNQLEMAILNLSVNARDAMPDGGMLRISVNAELVGLLHRTNLGAGRYIKLSVADTGVGMDEITLSRAIEPFFSTKGVGQGTGLGLSMAHGLASQLGGALTISSTPGVGTNVELWLPESTAARITDDHCAVEGLVLRGAGTVLLVDDEELIRLSTADMLTEFGYTVVEAGSAEHALQLIDGGLDVNLLVTDHLMPGMTGTELARTVLSHHPHIKALIVSGYAEAEGVAPDLPRLTKPFRSADLAESLLALTAAKSASHLS